jgi:hypothetical protein
MVLRDGEPPIAIEVTEYDPEEGRVGVEIRWHKFRETIEKRLREYSSLKGVLVSPVFCDSSIPGKNVQQAIADELVRCADWVLNEGRVGGEKLTIEFSPVVLPGTAHSINHHWCTLLSASDWPVLEKYVSVLHITRLPWDYHLPTHNPQAQSAWISLYPQALREPLDQKEDAVCRAIQARRYTKGPGPLWLLIVSNTARDLSSWVFGDETLKGVLDKTGFDFERSVFDRIWLLDASSPGRSQCLYPWGESS